MNNLPAVIRLLAPIAPILATVVTWTASAQMTVEEANEAYRQGRIDQALGAFLLHADQGNPQAQHKRGRLHYNGTGSMAREGPRRKTLEPCPAGERPAGSAPLVETVRRPFPMTSS